MDEIIFRLIIGALVGYVMYRFKKLEQRVDKVYTEEQTRQLIADKLEPVKVRNAEIKEDLMRIEGKLDRLIEKN